VVVVDDGSNDTDVTSLLSDIDVVVLKHEKNLGKGRAILTASQYIEERGGVYMVTIDADGQHRPEDIKKFIPVMRQDEQSLIIGRRNFDAENVPFSSRFGRSFANFWLLVETGQMVADCQSGFRAYPVRYLNQLSFKSSHYDFEAEVLAKAAWAGLQLKTVDISVIYPKSEERISSFRPVLDNLRLTRIHTMLVGRRLSPVRHKKLVASKGSIYGSLLRHPGKALKMLLLESATPEGLALSAAVGLFIAVLPILFMHSIVIFYVSLRLNLNKFVTLNVQHLAVPPFIPALCIEVGYYLRNGRWLTDLSYETVFKEFSSRIFDWFLGSLVVAPVAAALIGAIMYVTASAIKKIWCIHVSAKENS
jgi:glycosyltransferase involved in cell wall biosynthesis